MLLQRLHAAPESYDLANPKLFDPDEAADRLAAQAAEQGKSVREICATRFKDFHFGLKLIVQNSGPKEFVIDQDVVDTPDKVLSDWVVASYRSSGQAGGTTP